MFKRKWKSKVETDEPREILDEAKARERTMQRAVKLLAAKARSINELRERLLEKTWTNEKIVDGVLEKLEDYKFVDDNRFAHDYAASKLRQKPQGKRKLQQTLAQKQLDKETVAGAIEAVYQEMPEGELIDAAIEKRLRSKGAPKDRDQSKKLFDYLLRQGFSFDLVREKTRGLIKSETDNE